MSKSKMSLSDSVSDRGRYRAVSDSVWTAKKHLIKESQYQLFVPVVPYPIVIADIPWTDSQFNTLCAVSS